MKGICHLRSRGRHFSPSLPPSLPGDRYLKLGSKSDLRAEISGSIVRYDALAQRPEVLLLWHFVGACVAILKYIRGENIHIGSPLMSFIWGKFLQQVDKNFSLVLRSCLRCRKQEGNTFIVGKTMH